MRKITRREVLKKGGRAAAGAVLARTLAPMMTGCTPSGDTGSAPSGSSGYIHETDLLIIGTGLAGMWAAVSAHDGGVREITLVDKGAIGHSSMSKMCAGGTIYMLPQDDRDLWLREFIEVQKYLCPQDGVIDIFETSYDRLLRLESWGVRYAYLPTMGTRTVSRGFEHIQLKMKPVWGQWTGGAALVGVLGAQVAQRNVTSYSKVMITHLLVKDGRAAGAVGVHRMSGEPVVFKARAVILSAADCSFRGNYACVEGVTGDAFRLAYDAGARLSNMEFLVSNTGSPSYPFEGTGMATKFGALFRNADMNTFMEQYHPDADEAEVSHLVQAMANELVEGRGPPFYLDMTDPFIQFVMNVRWPKVATGFMKICVDRLKENGADITDSPQEWLPVIQSLRGGVHTDAGGMSDLLGLIAAGTSRSVVTGMFNGWSTMQAMGTGERAGKTAARFLREADDVHPDAGEVESCKREAAAPLGRKPGLHPDEVCLRLQKSLFPYTVCVRKNETALRDALEAVEAIRDNDVPDLFAQDPHQLVKVHETRSMVCTAELFLRGSLERRESRLDHLREDYPETDNEHWLKWITVRKGPGGGATLAAEDVPLESYPYQPDERG